MSEPKPKRTRRQYDEEFRRNAVALVESSGRPLNEIAADVGVIETRSRADGEAAGLEVIAGAKEHVEFAAVGIAASVTVQRATAGAVAVVAAENSGVGIEAPGNGC